MFREQGMEITVMDEIITSVSSSYIRSNIEACKELMPESVYRLIKSRGIYNA